MAQPSNAVLLEKINGLHEKFDGLKTELNTVKIETAQNTMFRHQSKAIIGAFTTIAGVIGGAIVWLLGKLWGDK